MSKNVSKDHIPQNPIQFGFFATKPHLKWAVSACVCVFIATGLSDLVVVVVRNLTDALAAPNLHISTVWTWAVIFPLLYLLSENTWRGSGFTGMRWFTGLVSTIYQILYEYLSLHSKEYFNNRFAGALASKISNVVDGMENLFEKILWKFIPLCMGLFWYMLFAGLSDWRLGAIIGLWTVFFLGINVWFAQKMQIYAFHSAESSSDLKGKIVDSLSNISLVHEYAYVAGEQEYIQKFIQKNYTAGLNQWWFSEWILTINGVLIALFLFAIMSTTLYFFQNHLITLGTVVMIIAIIGDLVGQLFFIGQEIRDAAKYYGEAKEGLKEILHEHTIVDAPHAAELNFSKGDISIKSMSFEYENRKVFDNFSIEIPQGQKVGFVGRSGAGKTTFVSLLLRHFDIQSGSISIDHQDIREVKLESLRRNIAFVPQDTSLFHRSIKENIRYSKPEASNQEVIAAAQSAQADDFIQTLPHKYDTLVGERGVKLSGGQRQRIAIARAFLKNSPILLLDEATSSLDSESEHAIQVSLERLMKGRTVIAIAHRLSTLKEMDRIVIIENGKIIEDGSPQDLLSQNGSIFKHMWDHQVKGFILDEITAQ